MGVQFARIETKTCPMFDPNCLDRIATLFAERRVQPFTKEDALALIEKFCGRFVKGKHVGAIRGYAHIEVCTVGGWKKDGPGQGNGHVIKPGTIVSLTIKDYLGKIYLEA